jgi:hypothetical protein
MLKKIITVTDLIINCSINALTFTYMRNYYNNVVSRNDTRIPYIGGTQDAGVAFYY